MTKRYKIILSILLPIICITSVCLSFLMPRTKAEQKTTTPQQIIAENTGASSASKTQKGGSIYVENGATYVMNGGTITGMTKTYGGAVYIEDGATFTMNAGTITGCKAKYGGAIYVASGGTCNINGGTITGNFAENAPAIYVENGAVLNVSENTIIEDNGYCVYVLVSKDTILVGGLSENNMFYYVDFGSYPQWYVGYSMNETLENWYNTSSPTSVKSYPIKSKMWEAYKYIDGDIYVRGLSDPYSASHTYQNGEALKSKDLVVWFKVAPIRWIVLNYEEYMRGTAKKIEALSYLAIASGVEFNNSTEDGNMWETSYMRNWLNEQFYNSAFTSEEKKVVVKTTIGNNITNDYGSSTSDSLERATEDNVYLLSYYEYVQITGEYDAKKRICSPTDFSLSNMCYKSVGAAYATATYPDGGACRQWTRSAGALDTWAIYFYGNGSIGNDRLSDVSYSNYGIRPALRISI